MKAICRLILISITVFAFITIFTSALAYHYLSNFDVGSIDHAIAVAKNPSTNIQLLREVLEQFGQITHGLLQAAKGALILAIGIGFISTGTLVVLYFRLNRYEHEHQGQILQPNTPTASEPNK